jgi:hypothetical protein
MKDLLAVATVRRLLLELGYSMLPEAPGGLVGPLALWITEPRVDLDGLTPLHVLDLPQGHEMLLRCLRAMLASTDASPEPHGQAPAAVLTRGRVSAE